MSGFADIARGPMLRAFVGDQAIAYATQLQVWEQRYGRPYVDRVVRMREQIPWGLEDARYLAARMAVFEWMASFTPRARLSSAGSSQVASPTGAVTDGD